MNKSATGPLIGYARVSTQGQDLAQQRATLREAGCTRIFEEKVSGAKRDRPELARLLDHLRAGDVVTVTRLDRLARSTRDLLDIAERIKEAGAGLRSLAEPWADTTTPAGRMVLTVFAGMADFERSLIVERTSTGRIAAKARGVRFGPRPSRSLMPVSSLRRTANPWPRLPACWASTAPPSTGPWRNTNSAAREELILARQVKPAGQISSSRTGVFERAQQIRT